MYVVVIPPNVNVSVQVGLFCFIVGVMVYTRLLVRTALGDAVVRAYVTPTPVVLCVAVTGSALSRFHVIVAEFPIVMTVEGIVNVAVAGIV